MKLVLFFFFTFALQVLASEITSVTVSEIDQFRAEWCAPNQIIAQDIKAICYGSAEFNGVSSTRAIVVQRADQTRELFIEVDFSSIDMMNLEFGVIGPVASSMPREKFKAKYTGQVRLNVNSQGEVATASGMLGLAEKFFAVRP